MSDEKYIGEIGNGYYDFSKKYWNVIIEANDLEMFDKICEQIRSLK